MWNENVWKEGMKEAQKELGGQQEKHKRLKANEIKLNENKIEIKEKIGKNPPE